jgi:hypothetical protein
MDPSPRKAARHPKRIKSEVSAEDIIAPEVPISHVDSAVAPFSFAFLLDCGMGIIKSSDSSTVQQ